MTKQLTAQSTLADLGMVVHGLPRCEFRDNSLQLRYFALMAPPWECYVRAAGEGSLGRGGTPIEAINAALFGLPAQPKKDGEA